MSPSQFPAFVLVMAGSDASGHAGIQADNRAVHAAGAFPLNVITALTLQTGKGVQSIDVTSTELVRMHLIALLNDYPVTVIKAGMLGTAGHVKVLLEILEQYPGLRLVLDPVLRASSGRPLLEEAGIELLREKLLGHAFLLTPNLPELARLTGLSEVANGEEERHAVRLLMSRGCRSVLVKGGHRKGGEVIDRLYRHEEVTEFTRGSVRTRNDRGTGCALASLIAAGLARGLDLKSACGLAKDRLTWSLETQAPVDWPGAGPAFL